MKLPSVNISFPSAKLRKTLKNLFRGDVEVFDKVLKRFAAIILLRRRKVEESRWNYSRDPGSHTHTKLSGDLPTKNIKKVEDLRDACVSCWHKRDFPQFVFVCCILSVGSLQYDFPQFAPFAVRLSRPSVKSLWDVLLANRIHVFPGIQFCKLVGFAKNILSTCLFLS